MSVRISPTVNGYAHIGHLVLALVNDAHRDSGKLYLRFEDYQPHFRGLLGAERIEQFKSSFRTMLHWAGIEFEEQSCRDILHLIKPCPAEAHLNNFLALAGRNHPTHTPNNAKFYLNVDDFEFHPYFPVITWNRVIWDNNFDVDPVIRGVDLVSESSLYQFFASLLDLKFPCLAYIPHLMIQNSEGHRQKLSKSRNQLPYQITEIMRHVSFEDALAVLKCCCLKETEGDFRLDNLKSEFVLHRDFMEMVAL